MVQLIVFPKQTIKTSFFSNICFHLKPNKIKVLFYFHGYKHKTPVVNDNDCEDCGF